MLSSPYWCIPFHQIWIHSYILTWRVAGVMHQKSEWAKRCLILDLLYMTLKTNSMYRQPAIVRFSTRIQRDNIAYIESSSVQVCYIQRGIKARSNSIQIKAYELTAGFQLCADNMPYVRGLEWNTVYFSHWHSHTAAFKRWCGQQCPYVWMTAT